MPSFQQTKSIARHLTLIILTGASLFLIEFGGFYLSNHTLTNGLTQLYHMNQLGNATRQIKQVREALEDTIKSMAQHSDDQSLIKIYRTIHQQGMIFVQKAVEMSKSDPEINKLILQTKESLDELQKLSEVIFSDPTNRANNMTLAQQFLVESIESLNKVQMVIKTKSDEIFERVYDTRFQPLVVGAIIATLFITLIIYIGLRTTRRLNRSIQSLLQATHAIVAGNLSFQAPILDQDEIGNLSNEFNKMTTALRSSTVSKNYVENIIESMINALLVLNSEGIIQRTNQIALKLFGYEEKELLNKPASLLFLTDYHLGNSTRNEETTGIRKDGKQIPISISTSLLKNVSSDSNEVVCVIEDITYRKNAEAELKKNNLELTVANKELEAFCYSVSHDLRTPLRGIDGFSQVLIEEMGPKLSEENRASLDRIRKAVQKMGKLIDDLLNLSRLSRTELAMKQINLSDIAKGVAQDLKEADPNRKVTFTIGDSLETMGDPNLIKIAIENLLGNAWKYTSKHPEAHIEVGVRSIDGRKAYFVRDDGAGFDMNYAKNLFGAFQRLHSPNEFPGTGVGLATVQRIIHRHGGSLWAESQVEKGATFYFTLG